MRSVKQQFNDAMQLAAAGQLYRARGLLEGIVERQPKNVDALWRLGQVLRDSGSYAAALPRLEQAAGLRRGSAQIAHDLGTVLQQLRRIDEALECFDRAVMLSPKRADSHSARAGLYERLHRLDEARVAAEQALEIDASDVLASIVLARLDRRSGEADRACERMERVLDAPMPRSIEAAARFELGRALDRSGRFDEAFETITAAQAVRASMPDAVACDADLPFRWLGESRDLIATLGDAEGDAGEGIVLLIGFPRSGTTLLEQICRSHPDVRTIDEHTPIDALVKIIGEQHGAYPSALRTMDDQAVATLSAAYADGCVRELEGQLGSVTVDKLPLNLLHLPLIKRVLPRAKLLVALRDPRDVCLSCVMQSMHPNASMVNLATLDGAARLYNAVMQLWLDVREELGLPYLEVRYEDVVSDTEAQARRLVDFLGVEWDDRVLRHHEQTGERFVSTPSYEAVSRPVTGGRVARWKRYERHFEPVRDVLQPFVEALGYD